MKLQDGRYGVAVPIAGVEIGTVHRVEVDPVSGVEAIWDVRIVSHDADTSIGVVSHEGRADALHAGRWRPIMGGAGYAVAASAPIEPGTRQLVLVIGSTGSAAMHVEAVEADGGTTTCYVIGSDGKSAPYAGPSR